MLTSRTLSSMGRLQWRLGIGYIYPEEALRKGVRRQVTLVILRFEWGYGRGARGSGDVFANFEIVMVGWGL